MFLMVMVKMHVGVVDAISAKVTYLPKVVPVGRDAFLSLLFIPNSRVCLCRAFYLEKEMYTTR